MFYPVLFYVASLLFWGMFAVIWKTSDVFNMVLKLICSSMALWSLILVLQTFVPTRGQ